MSAWLAGLNPEQAEAVVHTQGPLLILAGAGSGKTTVLISRCGYLIENAYAAPEQIQVLTFTNKAARELKHRVSLRLGSQAKGLNASTFHSFGLKFLRRYHKYFDYPDNFGIIDQNDAFGVLRDIARNLSVPGKDKFDFEQVYKLVLDYRLYSKVKQAATDEYLSLAEWIYPKYLKALKHLGVVDFEDLILKPIEILEQYPEVKSQMHEHTKYWMVDEFQDTNDLQMRLLHQLVDPNQNNITVVGDDDQAIYGFRGAMVKHILNFPKEFGGCKVIRLERNYRSTSAILDLANTVIAQNKDRHNKQLKPEAKFADNRVPELFVLEDELQEAEFIVQEISDMQKKGVSVDSIAILYRANSQSGNIETELKQAQVPYRLTGGISLFDRKEIKDVACYMRLMLGYHELSIRRIVNVPPRGIGETSLDHLLAWMETHKTNFLKALESWQEAGVEGRIGPAIQSFLSLYQELPGLTRVPSGSKWGEGFFNFLKKIGYVDHLLAVRVKDATEEVSFEKRLTPLRIFLDSADRYIERRQVEEPQDTLTQHLKKYLEIFDLKDDGGNEHQPGVQLMTLHASKGLEFDYVFLPGIEEDILPHKILGEDTNEERRLFYVGITRARRGLILSRAQQRKRYGALRPAAPSRFLNDLPDTRLKSYAQGVRPIAKGAIDQTVQNFLKSLEKKVSGVPKA